MKIAHFKYVDSKGKETERDLLITGFPSNKYSGIDISELDEEQQAIFTGEYNAIYEDFLTKVEKLKEEFDLKYNYRQFLETNVSDLKEEWL